MSEAETSRHEEPPTDAAASDRALSRRNFVVAASAITGGAVAAKFLYDKQQARHAAEAAAVKFAAEEAAVVVPSLGPNAVFIAKAESYEVDLVSIIRSGLKELEIGPQQVKGKSVLLKPNLVEPTKVAPHINTHPAMVRAAAEVFRGWDAKEVFVAEGQGHVQDSYLVIEASGLEPVLKESKLEFVDLNHDDVFARPTSFGATKLSELYLPKSLLRADIVVSMPKLKTHHWAGVTLSMKNLFGTLPGIVYGWPKNVLHQQGIYESILDIAATVRPQLAIIDGIVGMDGDGPIMGSPKRAGVVVMGRNLVAADATGTRVMGYEPGNIPYLKRAAGKLGAIEEKAIAQRGEKIESVKQQFRMLDGAYFDVFRGIKKG